MTSIHAPTIGITGELTLNQSGAPVCRIGQAYIQAIRKAGGIPLLIPIGIDLNHLDDLLSLLDGILLSGGGDIDPRHFNGTLHPSLSGVSAERDELEFVLIEKTLTADLPMLAICRGIQVLNVALGGTLHTDLADQFPDALKHDWYPDHPRDKLGHTVSLNRNSVLHEILSSDVVPVNSLHHQGTAELAEGLEAIAFAPDGLVEAVSVKDASFGLGVQWHPECLPDDPGMQALFHAFVETCHSCRKKC